MEGLHTVAETAARTGLSERRIRALCESGDVRSERAGARTLLIDDSSMRRWSRLYGSSPGRPLGAGSAWALLCLLSGEDAEWAGEATRASATRAMRLVDSPVVLSRMVRRRAAYTVVNLPAWFDRHLPASTTPTGLWRPEKPVLHSEGAQVDAYISAHDFDTVARTLPTATGRGGSAVLRVTDGEILGNVGHRAPKACRALDMYESEEPRASDAGRRMLSEMIRDANGMIDKGDNYEGQGR